MACIVPPPSRILVAIGLVVDERENDVRVRPERPADIPNIRTVHLTAFETSTEAALVDALRAQARPIVSLVADDGGAIVGHILFSPATLDAHPELKVMGLAPMAVVPARQRHGIGS